MATITVSDTQACLRELAFSMQHAKKEILPLPESESILMKEFKAEFKKLFGININKGVLSKKNIEAHGSHFGLYYQTDSTGTGMVKLDTIDLLLNNVGKADVRTKFWKQKCGLKPKPLGVPVPACAPLPPPAPLPDVTGVVPKHLNASANTRKVLVRLEEANQEAPTLRDVMGNAHTTSSGTNSDDPLCNGNSSSDHHNESQHNVEGNDQVLFKRFYSRSSNCQADKTNKAVLFGESHFSEKGHSHKDFGYLGHDMDAVEYDTGSDERAFVNVTQPFCMVCVGVQGSGKSHTMNVVLENCLVHAPAPVQWPIVSLRQPMCGLVLHYDQSIGNVCEAIGLNSVDNDPCVRSAGISPAKRVVILVSPAFYIQRKKFYGDEFEVRPLLFRWSLLGADQLKKLMRLAENDGQLYVSVMLDLLRKYQREDKVPVFADFLGEVQRECNLKAQSGPLEQRLKLLESVVRESDKNKDLAAEHIDLGDLMAGGTLVVADLTDPLLSADEANGIFQVLLEQFRKKQLKDNVGKVVAFDEAHKYLTGEGGKSGKDELSAAIVDTVRLMRHEGMRILVSTQSPLKLPSELLELVSVTVAHHFQSASWYSYLEKVVPMPGDGFERVKMLQAGEALVICTKMDMRRSSSLAPETEQIRDDLNGKRVRGHDNCIWLKMRPRLTLDYGASKLSRTKVTEHKPNAGTESNDSTEMLLLPLARNAA